MTATVATITTVQCAANRVSGGQKVDFFAHVSGGTGGTYPTGNVALKDGSTTLATVALEATPQADGTVRALFTNITFAAGGDHSMTAVYAGDATYITSTSAAVNLEVQDVPGDPNIVSSTQLTTEMTDEASQYTANTALGADEFGSGHE